MPSQPQDFKKSKKGATSAKGWKKKVQIELELPSGNVALVRAMRITDMLAEGFFPDNMRAVVMEQITKAEKGTEVQSDELSVEAMFSDPNKMGEMFEIFDKVLLSCVIEPKVLPAPAHGEERNEELLYADEVDLDDKVFIFQWAVGGDRDIDKFREEFSTNVGSMEDK